MRPQRDIVTPGQKFTSRHFSASAEIVAVRPEANEVDVRLTSSELHAQQHTWNLQHVKAQFECGHYVPVDPEKDKVNISVY